MKNKKDKPKKPRFEVKKRPSKEKPDYFQNIPSMKHPLAEILDFPPAQPDPSVPEGIEETADFSDSQTRNSGYPNETILDSQKLKKGYPKAEILDSNIAKEPDRIAKQPSELDSKLSKNKTLDSQKQKNEGNWTKYDKKRKKKGIFLRTEDDITKRFKQFCISNDWDFSHGTEIAWNKLMRDLDSPPTSDLDSLIALDDRRLKMLFKTKPSIINLYLGYNRIFNEFGTSKTPWKVKWSPRDDAAAMVYNETDLRIIELGIIQTQFNKGFGSGRIQTFKYYADEIENVRESGIGEETIEAVLTYHRKMWANQTGREVPAADV